MSAKSPTAGERVDFIRSRKYPPRMIVCVAVAAEESSDSMTISATMCCINRSFSIDGDGPIAGDWKISLAARLDELVVETLQAFKESHLMVVRLKAPEQRQTEGDKILKQASEAFDLSIDQIGGNHS